MKNERRKTPTNFMCLHIFGFNNLLQALFNILIIMYIFWCHSLYKTEHTANYKYLYIYIQ